MTIMGRKRVLTDEQRRENRRAIERKRRASASLRKIIAAQAPKEAPGVAKPIGDMTTEELRATGIPVEVVPSQYVPPTSYPRPMFRRGKGAE